MVAHGNKSQTRKANARRHVVRAHLNCNCCFAQFSMFIGANEMRSLAFILNK